MIYRQWPYFEHDTPQPSVEEQAIAAECADDTLDVDPRLSGMSELTRAIIAEHFGGDVDEAEYHALRLANCYRVPAAWVSELAGKVRAGWRDLNRTKC